MNAAEALRKVPLFEKVPPNDLVLLARKVTSDDYKKGAVVVTAGEPGDALYVITRGTVRIALPPGKPKGKELILAIVGEGEFFGEMSLLDGEPRSATVTVQTPATLLRLSREDLKAWLMERPEICLTLLGEVSQRVREAHRRYSSLALLDRVGKVVRVLLELAEQHGDSIPEGTWIPRLPTRAEVASMAGVSRETVSRTLRNLEDQGLVRPKGHGLVLLDAEQLRSALD